MQRTTSEEERRQQVIASILASMPKGRVDEIEFTYYPTRGLMEMSPFYRIYGTGTTPIGSFVFVEGGVVKGAVFRETIEAYIKSRFNEELHKVFMLSFVLACEVALQKSCSGRFGVTSINPDIIQQVCNTIFCEMDDETKTFFAGLMREFVFGENFQYRVF
jgi:hypothetical protein